MPRVKVSTLTINPMHPLGIGRYSHWYPIQVHLQLSTGTKPPRTCGSMGLVNPRQHLIYWPDVRFPLGQLHPTLMTLLPRSVSTLG
jgi:hypothetical protein